MAEREGVGPGPPRGGRAALQEHPKNTIIERVGYGGGVWAGGGAGAGRLAGHGLRDCLRKCGVGAMVEVNCETDFCAKSAPFVQFVKDICQVVLENNPADVEAIKDCTYPRHRAEGLRGSA